MMMSYSNFIEVPLAEHHIFEVDQYLKPFVLHLVLDEVIEY